MSVELDKVQVIHNSGESLFEATVDDYPSRLDYILDGKNFVITHVGVHPQLRGMGIAGKIVEVSLAYAKENNLRVIPMCSYAASFIRKHPEYAELTDQGRSE